MFARPITWSASVSPHTYPHSVLIACARRAVDWAESGLGKSKIDNGLEQKQFDQRKLVSAGLSEGDAGVNFSLPTDQVSIANGDRSRQYVSPERTSTSCVRSVQFRTSPKASRAALKSFFSSAN